MQKQILITVFFDIEDDLEMKDRDYDMFILNLDSNEDFRDKLFKVFDEKRYSWDNIEQFERGYKPVMGIEQVDLSDLKYF